MWNTDKSAYLLVLWASVYYNYITNKVGLYRVYWNNIINKLGYDKSSIYNFQYHLMKALQKYYWVETFNKIRIKKETSQADKSNVGSTKMKLCIKYCVHN